MADTIPSQGLDLLGAIKQYESGGDYNSVGPAVKGRSDRAYGAYQVMGTNVPTWTKEVLGVSMTPQQFLADPRAQDAVAQAKLEPIAAKYGPLGAASWWFTGKVNPSGNPSDGYHSNDQYQAAISKLMGVQGAMAPPLPSQTIGNAPPIAGPQQPPAALPGGAAPQQQQQQQPLPPQFSGAPAPAGQSPIQQALAQQVPALGLGMSPIAYYQRRFNPQQAFQKIPLPPGFTGYTG